MNAGSPGADAAGLTGAGALVLAIETSCDDTSVAVLAGGRTLRSHLIAAQDIHRLYGGVVPELASRAHLELLPPMVARALAEAGVGSGDLTGVAVTNAPGLVGSLVVGVAFAKAYGPRKLVMYPVRADLYLGMADSTAARRTLGEAIAFADSLPPGQRSESTLASLKKKLAGISPGGP